MFVSRSFFRFDCVFDVCQQAVISAVLIAGLFAFSWLTMKFKAFPGCLCFASTLVNCPPHSRFATMAIRNRCVVHNPRAWRRTETFSRLTVSSLLSFNRTNTRPANQRLI